MAVDHDKSSSHQSYEQEIDKWYLYCLQVCLTQIYFILYSVHDLAFASRLWASSVVRIHFCKRNERDVLRKENEYLTRRTIVVRSQVSYTCHFAKKFDAMDIAQSL
jgi:hypothetical protein